MMLWAPLSSSLSQGKLLQDQLCWMSPGTQLCHFIFRDLNYCHPIGYSGWRSKCPFSFEAKESSVSHSASKDFFQTHSKQSKIKSNNPFFPFPLVISTYLPQGFSKNSSNKVMACLLKIRRPRILREDSPKFIQCKARSQWGTVGLGCS